MEKKNKKLCLMVIMAFSLAGASFVFGDEPVQPLENCATPFNATEIIERVSHHPIVEGNTIVIKDQVYEAFFNEHGVVLKARKTKQDAEDLIIPVTGRPEIQGGKVVYQTEYGEIIFAGTSQGIKFEQTNQSSVTNYSGNVARLENEKITEWSREGEFLIDTISINNQQAPAAAFDGSNYLVVWVDERNGNYDIYGARVDQSGNVLDSSGIAIITQSDHQYNPAVACDSTNYLVVWSDLRNFSWPWHLNDIYGARVSQNGVVLDPNGIAIASWPSQQLYSAVAYDGTNYLVVWQDYWNIWAVRIDQSGIVLNPYILIVDPVNDQISPSVAFTSTDYLVVWSEYCNDSDWDIYGAKVNTSGVVIDSFPVSLQLGDQISPALAHGAGDQILITYSGWTDSINGQPVNAMRIWGKFYPFVGIEENTQYDTPNVQHSLQVFPNPVTKKCNIKYILPQDMNVHISMFDATGRLVKEIINVRQHAGKHQKAIDMSDLAQSVYFIRIETDKHSQTEKVIYLKQ